MTFKLRTMLLALALSGASRAADLTSSGDWVTTIAASNLVSGAGSDLQAQFESFSGVTTLTISNISGAWSLRARRAGANGHPDVAVSLKRTSGGSGSGDISGGTAYVELTNSDVEIFTGSEARSGVALQFKLTGLSHKVAPATYFSSIIFTVQ
ncbi:MAG: hypothetical protein WCF18_20725 [Chthoniobacteraceae bacterium]